MFVLHGPHEAHSLPTARHSSRKSDKTTDNFRHIDPPLSDNIGRRGRSCSSFLLGGVSFNIGASHTFLPPPPLSLRTTHTSEAAAAVTTITTTVDLLGMPGATQGPLAACYMKYFNRFHTSWGRPVRCKTAPRLARAAARLRGSSCASSTALRRTCGRRGGQQTDANTVWMLIYTCASILHHQQSAIVGDKLGH